MAQTALSFYRKRQSLESLDIERPQSLDTVRYLVLEAIQDVRRRLEMKERLFYGGKKCEDDISDFLLHLRVVMRKTQVYNALSC